MRDPNFIPNLLNDIVYDIACDGEQFSTYGYKFFDSALSKDAAVYHNLLFHFLDYLTRIYFYSALELTTWEDESTGLEQDQYSLGFIDRDYYEDPDIVHVEQYIDIIMQSNRS